MIQYSDVVTDPDDVGIAGVEIIVRDEQGALAPLFDILTNLALTQPIMTDAVGGYAFKIADGNYSLEYRIAGVVVRKDRLELGVAAFGLTAATIGAALNYTPASQQALAGDNGTDLVGFKRSSTTIQRTVSTILRESPVSVREMRYVLDADWTNAFIRAAATGRSVYVPGGDPYTVSDGFFFNAPGQRLLGDGVGVSVIRVPTTFNMDALGVLEIRPGCNETHAGVDGVGFTFDQPATPALRSQIVQYPPAIFQRDVSRVLHGRVRISNAWMGINADGNSGGLTADNLEISAYSVGLAVGGDIPGSTRGDNAGALDFITLARFSSWPHDLTPEQYAIYADGGSIGLQAGRVEALNITERLAFTCRDVIGTSEGRAGFGKIGYSMDAHDCRLDFNGGQYTLAGFYKTSNKANDYAIKQTAGYLTVLGGWTAFTGGGTGPQFDIQGGHFIMDPMHHLNGSPNGPIVRVGNGAVATVVAPDVEYGGGTTRTVGWWKADPGGRLTLVKPRLTDAAGGSGPAVTIDTDGWHDIEINALLGWGRSIPSGTTLGTYKFGATVIAPSL